MTKPRLLIPLVQDVAVRYLLRTGLLRQIAEFSTPVIMLSWGDPALQTEMEKLGSEVYPLPKFRYGSRFEHLKNRADLLHKLESDSPSRAIDRRRKTGHLRARQRLRATYREHLIRAQRVLPGMSIRLRENYDRAFWDDTNARDISTALVELRPDALFSVTPIRIEEDPVLRIARSWGLPCCTSIMSFDYLTTRGGLPIDFGAYLVWNDFNAREVTRTCNNAHESKVQVTGPPQFDFYWDPSYVWDETTWRRQVGLPEGRPVIFFGGGFSSVAPHEPQFLVQLDAAIEDGRLRERPVILFRRHPIDRGKRWPRAIERCRNVVVDSPWLASERGGHVNITRRDIERLVSTQYHSSVHVSTSSTLSVEGAILDRPQVGPAYDGRRGRRFNRSAYELYLREHYLPITFSGGLDVVRSEAEFVKAVESALTGPDRLASGRRNLVSSICTYTDGQSTRRVAEGLKDFLES